jgi:hypothetical protein
VQNRFAEHENINETAGKARIMSTIRFFKTNRTNDPGFELTTDEVAKQFWVSDEAILWLAKPGVPLERTALLWVNDNIGQWENIPADWDPIFVAIHAAMPREGRWADSE